MIFEPNFGDAPGLHQGGGVKSFATGYKIRPFTSIQAVAQGFT